MRQGASGSGSRNAPFGRVQDALEAAQPGDTVTIAPGTYAEEIRTVRNGSAEAPIRLRSANGLGSVVLIHSGRVLTVDHAFLVIDGLIFDGEYGPNDTIRVSSEGNFLHLLHSEVRRSSKDLVDMGGPEGVLIDGCLIHHALNAAGGRSDAHGIVAGPVHDLTVRNTEIHTFSGDGLQVDPGRSPIGWDRVTIAQSRIWLAPLPTAENGFAAGVVPGENAVDTKSSSMAPRAKLLIRDTEAFGFRDGLIRNMAAFNLKENVDVTVDGVTVHDSEIAFRMRGPTREALGGAWVTLMNAVVYDTTTAFRYEQDIEQLRIWNSTLGRNVARPFEAAEASLKGVEVRNLLTLGQRPREAGHPSNMSARPSAFIDVEAHDYHLAPGAAAIDAGVELVDVTSDREGVQRPQGPAFDVGAYEKR